MKSLISSAANELTTHILPFWMGLKDDVHGGFVGRVDYDLTRHPEAVKGCILNSRILWFFSECYMTLRDETLRPYITQAYDMLCRMTDDAHGGVYWALNADGSVADSTKHTYNQAFAVYALSACWRATGEPDALSRAKAIFELIERRCRDAGGYLEAFSADFKPVSNEKLSENGVMATRTMNTLLHVLEGYTGLYRADRDPAVRARLLGILDIWERHIYNPERRRQEVFFDHDYRSLIDHVGSGKDWGLDRKAGGLFVMPGSNFGTSRLGGRFLVRDLEENKQFLERNTEDYVVLSTCNFIYNIDLKAFVEKHIASGADITVLTKKATQDNPNILGFTSDSVSVTGKEMGVKFGDTAFLDLAVMKRELLLEMLGWYKSMDHKDLFCALIESGDISRVNVKAVDFDGYVAAIFDKQAYYQANMDLLNPNVLDELSPEDRFIKTKAHDNAPAKFEPGSHVTNSLVSAGDRISNRAPRSATPSSCRARSSRPEPALRTPSWTAATSLPRARLPWAPRTTSSSSQSTTSKEPQWQTV